MKLGNRNRMREKQDKRKNMKKREMKNRIIMLVVVMLLTLFGSLLTAYAKSDRTYYKEMLQRHYNDLKIEYDLTDEVKEKLDKIYRDAVTYLDDTDKNDTGRLSEIASQARGTMDAVVQKYNGDPDATEAFIMLSNEVGVTSARYGEETYVVLSLVNMGLTDLEDIIVTPSGISNDVTKWPFEIKQSYDAQTVQLLKASETVEEAFANRMDIGWYFQVRDDVKTGYYPLEFSVTYYVNHVKSSAKLTTYIDITGRSENGDLVEDSSEKTSKPRIIVTGFTTDPGEVYAGSTFNLTVTVKNTSKEEAVSNVLFNLEATVEGNDTTLGYDAFLPVSGSSSVYVDRISPGSTYDMTVEMEAKPDLAQKPYVMKVNMVYEDDKHNEYTDSANVSVPIKQELKYDTGTVDVLPEDIYVGDESNILFDIYNTGKTTIYNVKITYEDESLESGVTYIGNIQPGATANIDSTVTAIAPNEDRGYVNCVINYEDEKGQPIKDIKQIKLNIMDMPEEPEYDPSMYEDFEPEPQGLPIYVYIGIGVAVVVIIGIIVSVVLKKRKKKKEQQDLED